MEDKDEIPFRMTSHREVILKRSFNEIKPNRWETNSGEPCDIPD